jgi:hypothetical protein
VNLEDSPQMGVRFGIFNIPTIYLMREGQFYEFPLRRLNVENFVDLSKFALEEYSSIASNNGKIPADVSSALTKLWLLMKAEVADTEGGVISILLMKDPDTGEINYKAIIMLYVMPMLMCVSIFFIKCIKRD